MSRFIKALIRTLILFAVCLLVVIFWIGLAVYFSVGAAFIALIAICFLLSLYYNYKDCK